MDIKKVLLSKNINGKVYGIYPKTAAEIVTYKVGEDEITVAEALTQFADDLKNYINTEEMNAAINASSDALYNRIIGVIDGDTTVDEAFDTLKEVANWIDEHGDVVTGFNNNINALETAIMDINSTLSTISVDGGEI